MNRMGKLALEIIGRAIPIAMTAGAVYFVQWTDAMKARGGWWAVAGTVLMIVGAEVYKQ